MDTLDEKYVLDSLRSAQHSWGPNCVSLEQEWARWNGNKFCCATNSGTAALHMGVAACGAGAGDEVICTAFSWTSSATCVLHHHAIPVFVDIDFATMNMDPARIEAAVSERTRAIIPVHLMGLPADMDPILAVAARHRLAVIEDACQAHGALYKGRKVGTLGQCAAFSTNQNKMLSSGDGGLFVTDDPDLHQKARMLMNFGEFRAPHENRDYHSYGMGWQYRATDVVAAYCRAQLMKLDGLLTGTRRLARVVLDGLAGVRGLIPPVEPAGRQHNWYNVVYRVDPKALGFTGRRQDLRDAVVAAINAEGVRAGMWQRWILPAMTVFQAKNGFGRGSPWSGYGARDVSYDVQQFPEALRHVETYFILHGNRPPNDENAVRLLAQAVRKVMDDIRELDVDKFIAQRNKKA
jgi:dTDP-4-amino-4,6-dideoxygalactose transaminase